MKNTIGSAVSFTLFGESHGPAVGGVLDGLAAGIPIDRQRLDDFMQRRRAKADGLTTARVEADQVEILSGLWNGRTTGTPLAFVIQNRNTRSADYRQGPARPGHADWTAHQKYEGFEDWRGGGHFSGRLTAPIVAAGGICEQILAAKGIQMGTHIARIADAADRPFTQRESDLKNELIEIWKTGDLPVLDSRTRENMKTRIRAAAAEGDSVGGILETAVLGLPGGLGEPFFDSVESTLSHLLFSIPAVKGVEFGLGFGFADHTGSEVNDPLAVENGRICTRTNHNGGINGGITNGMPLLFRSCVKPTPSIGKAQDTVDLLTGQPAELAVRGRHDPCILPRAAIVQTAVTALALLDLCTQRYGTLWQSHEKE